MIRAQLVTPPLIFAAMSLLAMPAPASRAAEPAFDAPRLAGEAQLDQVEMMLRSFEPTAVFTGRTKEGTGYVIMSMSRAYFIKAQPGGIVRITQLEPKAVKFLIASYGWRL